MEMTRRAMTENIMERTGDGPLANIIILGNLLTIHGRKEEKKREGKGKERVYYRLQNGYYTPRKQKFRCSLTERNES